MNRSSLSLICAVVGAMLVGPILGSPIVDSFDQLGDVNPPPDWNMVGEVADTLEIPNSGGSWSVTLRRSHPCFPDAAEFLQVICDRNQKVVTRCARLSIGEVVEFSGYVLSNEPNSGQRLSATGLFKRVP